MMSVTQHVAEIHQSEASPFVAAETETAVNELLKRIVELEAENRDRNLTFARGLHFGLGFWVAGFLIVFVTGFTGYLLGSGILERLVRDLPYFAFVN